MTDSLSPLPTNSAQNVTVTAYPHGHALYHRYKDRYVPVLKGITFVDATNSEDPTQDGTAEHPWASIQTAVTLAGENAVIFIREGVYRETVALKPGQTLTSAVELTGPLVGAVYAEVRPPLIEPETLHECLFWTDEDTLGAALILPPGASARGLEIVARRPEGAEKPDWAAAVAIHAEEDTADNAVSVRDCVIRTEGRNARAVVLVASGQKATLRGELTGNRIRTEGANAGGILVLASNEGQTRHCIIQENDIATSGEKSHGIFAWVSGGGLHEALILRGNIVATTGAHSDGLRMNVCDQSSTVEESRIRALEVRDNTVTCLGNDAVGLSLLGLCEAGYAEGETVLEDCTVGGNTITTGGEEGHGVYALSLDGVRITKLTIQENTIITAGAKAAGIRTEDYGFQRDLMLRGNVITTKGDKAEGLRAVSAHPGGLDSFEARDNRVSTTGNGASGIHLNIRNYSSDVYLSPCVLTGNTVATTGQEADGLRATFDETCFGQLTFQENKITTTGDKSQGVNVQIADYDGASDTLTVCGNTVATKGKEADAVHIATTSGYAEIDKVVVQDSALKTAGAGSRGLYVEIGEYGRIATFEARNNRLNTLGDSADGIALLVFRTGEEWPAAICRLWENTIVTEGSEAKGVYALSRQREPRTLSLRENDISCELASDLLAEGKWTVRQARQKTTEQGGTCAKKRKKQAEAGQTGTEKDGVDAPPPLTQGPWQYHGLRRKGTKKEE